MREIMRRRMSKMMSRGMNRTDMRLECGLMPGRRFFQSVNMHRERRKRIGTWTRGINFDLLP